MLDSTELAVERMASAIAVELAVRFRWMVGLSRALCARFETYRTETWMVETVGLSKEIRGL